MRRQAAGWAGAVAGGGLVASALWWRRHPSACPYGQRFWVEAPHPLITRPRLREALDLFPGERLLEIGPGTGYYSVPIARWLGPDGRLDVFDLQAEMLDHTLRRAAEAGVAGRVHPTQGDAQALPYGDGAFDGAYIVCALGEIPDQDAVLRELRRVVRTGGRVVVGELAGDPHMVTLGALRRRAQAAGLTFELRVGPRLGYFARFRAP